MSISFTLNRVVRTVSAEPGENLQVLLQRMGIPSVRRADDGEGFVGADTILFEGRAVLAGLMVAGQAEGHSIETVESLMQNGQLSALQGAMLDAGVVQSAFTSPAAALLIEELLRRSPEPTEEDVADALSGLFSRSTGTSSSISPWTWRAAAAPTPRSHGRLPRSSVKTCESSARLAAAWTARSSSPE